VAYIVLIPGESYEHVHRFDSVTTLLKGNDRLDVAGQTSVLTVGKTVQIPAEIPHVMRNVGEGEAVISCGKHGGA
jgi:quercetin dioxygenase-like cupin family protein